MLFVSCLTKFDSTLLRVVSRNSKEIWPALTAFGISVVKQSCIKNNNTKSKKQRARSMSHQLSIFINRHKGKEKYLLSSCDLWNLAPAPLWFAAPLARWCDVRRGLPQPETLGHMTKVKVLHMKYWLQVGGVGGVGPHERLVGWKRQVTLSHWSTPP